LNDWPANLPVWGIPLARALRLRKISICDLVLVAGAPCQSSCLRTKRAASLLKRSRAQASISCSARFVPMVVPYLTICFISARRSYRAKKECSSLRNRGRGRMCGRTASSRESLPDQVQRSRANLPEFGGGVPDRYDGQCFDDGSDGGDGGELSLLGRGQRLRLRQSRYTRCQR
jgi:hypothetical protein